MVNHEKIFRGYFVCFNYLGYFIFAGTITQVIDPGVTTFRVLMICGIIISFSFSFLSEKGLWRKLALGLSIFVGLVYFMAVELMRIIFQGNGF
ncbi:hypothetical protein P4646_24000 [Peribacillus simplex]|uniref:hypothetical protein n=1 Tax=Peribacillus simplex TaxID=1478 RepID=UPI001D3FD0A3|nr:hypothetical protein [Peribacillus simplex]MED3987090.1 hypothetical protein [Peribacillus simplex]MED4095787.1 hypothetical protein [Peribacillus simplex]CAH0271530.1 hypothetical protein SRABI84_03652 [Peribacillus simplex]